jgi:hypothetical protein
MRLRKLFAHDVHGEETGAPAAVLDPTDAEAPVGTERDVQLIYGASVQTLPLVGLRIAEIRPIVQTILRVHPSSPALVNGRPVRPDYVVTSDDVLEFVHHAGEKG